MPPLPPTPPRKREEEKKGLNAIFIFFFLFPPPVLRRRSYFVSSVSFLTIEEVMKTWADLREGGRRREVSGDGCGGWSLASEFSMSFLLINIGGASYCRMISQQVNRAEESRWELCRIGRERFMMGKWLEIAYFRTSVFPIIPVFPRSSRKKNRATFSPESEPYPFSTYIQYLRLHSQVAVKVLR